MNKDYNIYLYHILESIENIERYTKGLNWEEFLKSKLVQDGVIRNLEIIGEATKNIPAAIKAKYTKIEWKKMAGMRDILIHDYLGVDLERVWRALCNRLPVLKQEINKILR